MKVRFLKSVSGNGFSFRKFAEAEIPSEMAKDFLNAGFCEVIAEPAKKRAQKAVKKKTKKETR